ncbi:MAG: Rrf2 family transcriptional regulator [Alphaproteobacteria bacterium]
MQVHKFTDYGLRVLLALAENQGKEDTKISATDVAKAHNISLSHVQKSVNLLSKEGIIIGQRGRGGGLSLALPASEYRLGQVVATLERDNPVINCGEGGKLGCAYPPNECKLKYVLVNAQNSFYQSLDQFTLADIVEADIALFLS